jgi:mannose-6-phosphate isomerase-like protein (cupin superfamily)
MIVKQVSEVVPESVGDFKRWYLSRADRGHSLSVRYVEVDGIVRPHSHTVEETIFYIEGRGLVKVGEQAARIKPGTMLVIPPGSVHSSIREGLAPLRYLAIFVGNTEL